MGSNAKSQKLDITRRQIPALNDPTSHLSASFADGLPFLLSRKIGSGYLYACATLPEAAWSLLGEGFVLLPMVQRALQQGSRRLSPPSQEIVGEWKPADPAETWTNAAQDSPRDWRWHAGIYQSGQRKIALNPPVAEIDPDVINTEKIKELLPGLKLDVLAGAVDVKADHLQSEIWPLLVVFAMLAMCIEMWLATSKGLTPNKLAPLAQ